MDRLGAGVGDEGAAVDGAEVAAARVLSEVPLQAGTSRRGTTRRAAFTPAPCRVRPYDAGRRAATRSQTASASAALLPSAISVTVPSAPSTTAAFWSPSKPVG